MPSFAELLEQPLLQHSAAPNLPAAVAELGATVPLLAWLAEHAQENSTRTPIRCEKYWNPLARTYTYHTHTLVEGIDGALLETIAAQFFNAYALERQDWYSQFVGGAVYPLPAQPVFAGTHQLGEGYFDFGVSLKKGAGLRRYHTLFSQVSIDPQTIAVVLRTVNAELPTTRPARQVYLLPPTGDVFSVDAAGLHWHHICTTTGIGLLPEPFDRWLMNALRACGLDGKERDTYLDEAQGFIRHVEAMHAGN